MAVMEAGSVEHRARIAELEGGLGPFDDPAWRDELGWLLQSARAGSMFLASDCEALVELAARVPRSPGDERGGTPWTSFIREVAVAKKISDQAAHAEVALAHRMLACHPVLLAALHAGRAPEHRARILVQECARYPEQVAQVADRLLADRLNSLPPWRIRHEVTQLALRLDPEAAAAREAAATADRSASLTGLPDAQSEIVLTGPAPLVQRWWDALTDQARALKAAGDPRPLAALRFDLAVHTDPRGLLGHDSLADAVGIPDPTPEPAAAEPACAEPSPAEQPPAPPSGLGVNLRDDARCSRPVQASITVPAATALGLADEPGWLDGYGWISAPLSRQLLTCAELRKACTAPHSGQLVDVADRLVRPRTGAGALREAVRSMVLTPHELRTTVIDSQPGHDPRPALEAFVHARDRWCDGPTGTQTPARRTDTDHRNPWPAGPTRASNLASRAPRTHQLKHAGWTATRTATGTTWTSPAGQTAHTPRFDHPPPPLPPRATLPDPDALAARDRALTRAPTRPWEDRADGEHRVSERPVAARPAGDGPAAASINGWPADPPF